MLKSTLNIPEGYSPSLSMKCNKSALNDMKNKNNQKKEVHDDNLYHSQPHFSGGIQRSL